MIKQVVTNVVLIAAIVGGTVALISVIPKSAETEQTDPEFKPLLVEVTDVPIMDGLAVVASTGSVEAARQLVIIPEVSGKLTKVHPELKLGGRLEAGELLLKIDGRDYGLAVEAERSRVESARTELELEEGRAAVAEREWEMVGVDPKEAPNGGRLALRKPQQAAAKTSVASAKASLNRAKLTLSRTTIRAPFNATVTAESVEKGQVVQPGSQLATLVGSDAMWVRVSVPLEKLSVLTVPGLGGAPEGEGSKAHVIQRVGGEEMVREGKIIGLVGQLDSQTRRAQVLVEVLNPLDPPPGQLPLLPGAFVDVEMDGRPLASVRKVPRRALIQGDDLLVADKDDKLRTRHLSIAWSDADFVYSSDGIQQGDRAVLSKISTPIEGMDLLPETGADKVALAADTPVADAKED